MRLVEFTMLVKALLLSQDIFFLSLKQHVSDSCAFDEENGLERLKRKGINEKNLTFIIWKKPKLHDFYL